MYSAVNSILPESSPKQPALDSSDAKFRKKVYITIAVIITAAMVIAALIIPYGSAIIPLDVNYAVGEKMVYDTTMIRSFQIFGAVPL